MILVDIKPQQKTTFSLIGKVKLRVVIFLVAIATILVATQLIFAASLATGGQNLSGIETEIKLLESQNSQLKIEIAKESSLSGLSQKAQELGFKKPQKVITP